MSDFLTDGADVSWVVGNYQGLPILIIQADGPHFAANALAADYNNLRVTGASIFGGPEGEVHRLMVFDDPRDLMKPLLTCDSNPEMIEFAKSARAGNPWLMFVQILIEGKKHSVVWITAGKADTMERRTKRAAHPDGNDVVSYWMKDLNDD